MADILWHGTSSTRLASIAATGFIHVAPYGVQGVSMTDRADIALYFATLAADADEALPVVLALDADRLRADGYELEPYSDGVWGDGECDWERETICWQDIPTRYLAIDVKRAALKANP